jgi:hypothetical protein
MTTSTASDLPLSELSEEPSVTGKSADSDRPTT